MEKKKYIENFEKLGFGLFVHFGLYSRFKVGEWCLDLNKKINKDDYLDISKFKISPNWAKKLVEVAKKSGCKYITITARHHDGFSLYDTKGLSDFDSMHSASNRDLIKEFVDECNKNSIVPFFYHTLLDWHNKDYNDNFPKYIDYLVNSVEILCKNYGTIGGFWFDGMWNKPNEDWQEDRLYSTIRKYQPNAMIINNTGLNEQGKVGNIEIDSVTFERGNPCFVDNYDKYRAGEMCQVLNDHWGYAENDFNYKPIKELIDNLVECRKFNCNFLLNTGLKGNGLINEIDKCILKSIGYWIKVNKNFIYNAKSADIKIDGADVLFDGKYYYAIFKNVPMCADENVAKNGDHQVVSIDFKIKNAIWLDSNIKVEINNNKIKVLPFEYGYSMINRVMRFSI